MTAASSPAAPAERASLVNDPKRWDTRVAELGAQPFQSWAWGTLKSRFGWQPFRLMTNDQAAAAQLLVRPYRGLAVAYVPRGPISAEPAGHEELIKMAIRVARSRRAAFVRVEPGVLQDDPSADLVDASLRRLGFRPSQRTLQPRSTIRLDLSPPEEDLFAGFSKGHRADVRRAERDGVSVRVGSPSESAVLHQMLAATNERKHFGFHSAAYYKALLEAFGDAARLQIAELDGQPIGASVVLAFGRHGTYLAAGSDASGLQHRAAHLLQWQAIRWAKERGALTWDLWGIADARGRHELAVAAGASAAELAELEAAAKHDPLDGVYRFKKGWGGQVVRTLPAYDRVFIAPAYWFWQWRRGEA